MPSDGEILREILLSRRLHDQLSESQWWACIPNSKPRDLQQLLNNRPLAAAFETLADMPGLWTKLQLGALRRLLRLKCDEEMIRYLEHIKRMWDIMVRCGNTTLPYSIIDDTTAEKLEGLCPRYSCSDWDYVVVLMQNCVLFPSVKDECLRRALLANIKTIPCLIPSLWTFFETLKYLEPLCDILRRLLGKKMEGTIRGSLLSCFYPPERSRVQTSEKYHVELRAQPDRFKAAEIAYVQLWAFCSRHFNSLSTFTPKMNGENEPVAGERNPVLWQRLVAFASDLGFQIPEAAQLGVQDPRSELAVEYLTKACPWSLQFSTAQIQRTILTIFLPEDPVEAVMKLNTTEIVKERRFGRVSKPDLEEDRHHLFVPSLFQHQDFLGVSLQFVRRDLFQCLFGPFHFEEDDFGPPILSSTARESGLSADTEVKTDGKKRRIVENEVAEVGGKEKRLRQEVDRLTSELEWWNREVAKVTLEGEELRNRIRTLESQREANCDIPLLENAGVQGNSEGIAVSQPAEQLETEQQQADMAG